MISSCSMTEQIRCIVLTMAGAQQDESLRKQIAQRGWSLSLHTDPYTALAEASLREASQQNRTAWGLTRVERCILLISDEAATALADEIPDIQRAVDRFIPDLTVLKYQDEFSEEDQEEDDERSPQLSLTSTTDNPPHTHPHTPTHKSPPTSTQITTPTHKTETHALITAPSPDKTRQPEIDIVPVTLSKPPKLTLTEDHMDSEEKQNLVESESVEKEKEHPKSDRDDADQEQDLRPQISREEIDMLLGADEEGFGS